MTETVALALTEIPWHRQSGVPLLALLQLLPLAAAALLYALRDDRRAFRLGMGFAAAELGLAIELYRRFDPTQPAMQFAEWLALGGPLDYHAAADGITVLWVLLTALLTLMVVLYGYVRPLKPQGRLLATLFVAEATLIGMFCTVDLLWFVLFSTVDLIVIGHLLWAWSRSPERDLALARYLQFIATGIVLLVVGTLLLGWNHAAAHGGVWTFNLFRLVETPINDALRTPIFFLLFYGLAVRIPFFPLHGWLPVVAEHGAIAVAPVLLLGLKVGIYGLLRFVFPLLPETVVEWQPYVVGFAVVGIFYAATLALLQNNLRRLLAFAVVSHTSVLVVGLFSLGQAAFQGAMILAVNFGLAASVLLFMTGLLFRRTHTALLPRLGGLYDRIPMIGNAFFVAGLSIVGMPGTPGFDGAHLILEAAVHRFGALVTVAAALGNVAAAAFLLWAFQRAFLGARAPTRPGVAEAVEPTQPLERLLALLAVGVLLGVGFYSAPWLRLVDGAALTTSAFFGPAWGE